ncbi:MAG TPA: hypothetical protein VGL12_12645 [Roseiarcus sp.]
MSIVAYTHQKVDDVPFTRLRTYARLRFDVGLGDQPLSGVDGRGLPVGDPELRGSPSNMGWLAYRPTSRRGHSVTAVTRFPATETGL